MNLIELRQELRRHAVQLTLSPEGKLRVTAPKPPPDPVLQLIRDHQELLLQDLTGTVLQPLPEGLRRLVLAAISPGLSYPAALPSGQVMNLGDFVLASAALYAAGVDPQRQLDCLWQARRCWAA